MNETQKIIKYLAIVLALFLIASIISGVFFGITVISNIFNEDGFELTDKTEHLFTSNNANTLDIDIISSDVVIKLGDSFRGETNNPDIAYKENNRSITIVEKKHNWFKNNSQSQLVIYIPKDMVFDEVSIASGAGRVDIEKLVAKELSLDLGAGRTEIDNLVVLNNTEIDSGAGEVRVNGGTLNNLRLDMGVGQFDLKAKVLGNGEIDHGVGEVNLTLFGDRNDYQLQVDKGVGSITVNGNEVKDNEIIGNGINKIDIDSGVGSMKILFEDEELK